MVDKFNISTLPFIYRTSSFLKDTEIYLTNKDESFTEIRQAFDSKFSIYYRIHQEYVFIVH